MAVDVRWRDETAAVESLRAATKPKGKPTADELIELGEKKASLKALETSLVETENLRNSLLAQIPNPPSASTPDGSEDEDAIELRKVGEPRVFDFPIRDHLDLGGFDPDRGARLSGSRFVYRMGAVAMLELSLYRFALDRLCQRDFVPVLPPVLVREEAMYGTGFLPTDEVNLYRLASDDLYLTGTSEVALAGLHMGEILSADELPLRYAGYSTCFRREAGSAGRDTRGIFRVHQFDKVEMFTYVDRATSEEQHEQLLAIEEGLVQELGLAYRVVNIAAGDLGPSASKKYDIEAWIPSQERYREITSCSNTTDYQARRLGVRVRSESGSLEYPHTLNGTAMTARWLIALLETFQEPDGSVTVPEVLLGFGAPARIETLSKA